MRSWARQEVPCIFWNNPKIHYGLHSQKIANVPLNPIVSQVCEYPSVTPHLRFPIKISFQIIVPSKFRSRYLKGHFLPAEFETKFNHILFDLVTLIYEQNKPRRFLFFILVLLPLTLRYKYPLQTPTINVIYIRMRYLS